MGAVKSKNEIDNAIKASVSVFNQSSQACNAGTDRQVNVTIRTCPGQKVDIENWDITQFQKMSTSCIQNAKFTTNQKATITSKFSQLAKSISQNLSLNPGDTETNNIVRTTVDLGANITNIFEQTCDFSANQVVNLSLDATGGTSTGCLLPDPKTGQHDYGDVKWVGLNIDQAINGQLKCLMKNTSINTQVTTIKTAIDQKATSIMKNALAIIGMIILLIVIIVGGLMIGGTKAIIPIIIVVVLAGGGYFLVAWLLKIWPFTPKPKPDGRTEAYQFPEGFTTKSRQNVCAIAYNFLTTCDQASWPVIRFWLFPKADKNDTTSATKLCTIYKAIIPVNIVIPPPKGTRCTSCACSCKSCMDDSGGLTGCEAQCMYGYCPGDDDSKYDKECVSK